MSIMASLISQISTTHLSHNPRISQSVKISLNISFKGSLLPLKLNSKRHGIIVACSQSVTFADVVGLDDVKDELQQVVLGPPGTGKSLLANALSWESVTPLLSCSPRECVRFRDLFARAKKTRSIILIDEIDAIEKQDLRELFIEMDKIDKNPGVIVLATASCEDPLDQALFRRGRFELVLRLEVPDTASRNAILEALVSKKRFSLGEDLNLAEIASMTTGFSGEELANVVDEAALLAAGRYQSVVGMIDFVNAVEQSTAREKLSGHELLEWLNLVSVPKELADFVKKIPWSPGPSTALSNEHLK